MRRALDDYVCPVCGETVEWESNVYRQYGEIIGCEYCMKDVFAEDFFSHEDQEYLVCPICGENVEEGETIYLDEEGKVIGCECCIKAVSTYEQAVEDDELARDHHEQMLTDEYLGK